MPRNRKPQTLHVVEPDRLSVAAGGKGFVSGQGSKELSVIFTGSRRDGESDEEFHGRLARSAFDALERAAVERKQRAARAGTKPVPARG